MMNRRLYATWLRKKHSRAIKLVVSLFLIAVLFVPASLGQAQSGDIGYRIHTYPSGTGGNSDATGEKPESKLWWNDGSWYAVMWSTASRAFNIYRLNLSTQTWTDTGVASDDRLGSKQDVLWDGTKLYIVSHLFVFNAGAPAAAGSRGELYRYSYDTASKTYALDTGFPVEVSRGVSETLVIDKDSAGTLWVTYVESNTVMVNHSLNGDDRSWATPFPLPAGGAEKVNSDDISSVITYNQHVGIMWSNQTTSPKVMYFAVHPVGAPPTTWTRARAYSISGDDHISLKSMQNDSAGNLFAVIKTARNAALIVVLVCKNNGNRCINDTDWTPYTVYNSATNNPTRPILLIDETNRDLYVFTRNEDSGTTRGGIYYKRADMDNISFPTGMGTPFIRTALDYRANDPTSTKQNLNATTGLVVMASDTATHYYLHNYLSLGSTPPPPPPAPVVSSFSPTSGPVGTEVTITGSNFTGVSEVRFNGTAATSFTAVSATQVRAVVPSGASSGPVSVKTSAGTGTSTSNFTLSTVTPPPGPVISSFSPANGPAGTEVTLNGSNFNGVTAVTFNGLAAQSFAVDSSTKVRAVVPSGATSGLISVTGPGGTANSASNFLVTDGNTDPSKLYLTIVIQGGGTVTSSPFADGYAPGTVVTLTAVPNAGWVFAGWSGALSGTTNPATVTMDANKQVTATFVQQTGGSVAHQQTVTGTALLAQSVSTGANLDAASGNLYLAAVSSRSVGTVGSVSGLGLNWVRAFRQCAGRNQTMTEVWMAQGTPTGSTPVTATFTAAFKSAVIAVSRYSGASSSQPIGNVVAGNTLGVNGACTGGVDNASYSLPITTGSPGAVVYIAAAMRNRTHTPGSGYTERGETSAGSSGDIASIAVSDRPVPSPTGLNASGSFSGTADWSVVALEIRP